MTIFKLLKLFFMITRLYANKTSGSKLVYPVRVSATGSQLILCRSIKDSPMKLQAFHILKKETQFIND